MFFFHRYDARHLAAALAHPSVANVEQRHVHATIVGEHGDSEFPLWSTANISGVPIRDWAVDGNRVFTEDVLADLAHEAAYAAYKIIEARVLRTTPLV